VAQELRLTLDAKPEGTAGQVLRVNSGATALEYADPAAGGSTVAPLMQDGVVPATPVENEARDDWLYQG
jgi:hypothetical protein